ALRPAAAHALPVLLQVHVGRRQAVDDGQAGRSALRLAVGADRPADPVLELRIQITVEEVRWLHDVHVAVHEPEPVLHGTLLFIGSPRPAAPQPRDVLQLALPLLGSPRTAGPQPRDVLRLALPLLGSPRTAEPQPRDVLRLAPPL